MNGLTLIPRLTEKTYGLSSAKNHIYVFDVDNGANKISVKQAVEGQFKVSVINVRLLNNKGKAKRTIAAKGRKVFKGSESTSKKAYVTLKPGDNLPFFQAIEEEEKKQERTQEKMTKAMEKQEAKEAKAEAKSKPKAKSVAKDSPVKPDTKVEQPAHKKFGFLRLGGRRGGDKS